MAKSPGGTGRMVKWAKGELVGYFSVKSIRPVPPGGTARNPPGGTGRMAKTLGELVGRWGNTPETIGET